MPEGIDFRETVPDGVLEGVPECVAEIVMERVEVGEMDGVFVGLSDSVGEEEPDRVRLIEAEKDADAVGVEEGQNGADARVPFETSRTKDRI